MRSLTVKFALLLLLTVASASWSLSKPSMGLAGVQSDGGTNIDPDGGY
jgi:hypothetical protein